MTNFSFAQPRMKWLLETLRVQEAKKNFCDFRHPDSPMALFEINTCLFESNLENHTDVLGKCGPHGDIGPLVSANVG